MALNPQQEPPVLDLLFDEDNGVLKKEFDYDFSSKAQFETPSFNDLDLLSSDFLEFLPSDVNELDLHSKPTDTHLPKQKIHSDHDYFAHSSPGQRSDSGASVNSVDLEDSYLPNMAAHGDGTELLNRESVISSPNMSDSLSPFSDSNSDPNPLGMEDIDMSTCMDFDSLFSTIPGAGDGLNMDTIDSSPLSCTNDADISIDFDFGKDSDLMSDVATQQHGQTPSIKTTGGQPAIILVDANTRQPLHFHRLTSRNSSDSDSLPFTMKDVTGDLFVNSDSGKFPELRLTDEEKSLLAKEGVSLPTNMPLTKEEERVLKAVRRKIRNKVSAKESRKRKQGYVDGLERRVKICTHENQQLHKKVESLEKQNTTLVVQLNRLKAMVSGKSKIPAQASTCVMVLALSFALLVIPNISPFGTDVSNTLSSDNSVRGSARSLLGKDEQQAAEVSLFTKEPSQDSDPYGVSSKSEMPWEGQNSILYSTKKDVPPVVESSKEKLANDHGGEKIKQLVHNTELNDTEGFKSLKEQEMADTVQNDLRFGSEAGKVDQAAEHESPPAKKARKEVVEDVDL